MLKMGQMCHCISYWTVVSFDANGELRYKLDTYDHSTTTALNAAGLLCDGTDLYVLGQAVPSEDDGVLQKWNNIDGTPSREWFSDRDGQTQMTSQNTTSAVLVSQRPTRSPMLAKSADSAIWGSDQGQSARWSSAGVQSGRVAFGSGVDAISGSNEVHLRQKSSPAVRRYDSGLSVVDTSAALSFTPDETIRAGSGFMATSYPGIAFLDSGLGLVAQSASGSGDYNPAATDDGSHGYAQTYVSFGSVATLRKLDTALSVVWSVNTSSYLGTCAICDADDNVYLGDASTSPHIKKFASADGALQWTIDSFKVYFFRRHSSGNILAVGSPSGGGGGVMMFGQDGTPLWTSYYTTSNATPGDCQEDADGNIYVCGERVKREAGVEAEY